MCRSIVDIQSPTAEIRRAKKKKEERRNRMKIYMVSLFHRATIKNPSVISSDSCNSLRKIGQELASYCYHYVFVFYYVISEARRQCR